MLESDADRLAEIQALGNGSTLKFGSHCFDVIFDHEYVLAGDVEERAPVALMRSSDVDAAQIRKGGQVKVGELAFRIRRLEPDGTGMTRVIMEAP